MQRNRGQFKIFTAREGKRTSNEPKPKTQFLNLFNKSKQIQIPIRNLKSERNKYERTTNRTQQKFS